MFRPSTLVLATLALVTVSGSASAISRYESTSMSCNAVIERLRAEGEVIFRYPSKRVKGLTLYDRFVAHGGFCGVNEEAIRVSVPSRSGECPLLTCKEIVDDRSSPFAD